MPRISIMTMAFEHMFASDQLDDATMLARLEEMGYDGIEIASSRVMHVPELMKVYLDYLANSRLKVSCVDGISNLASPDPEKHATAVALLKKAIDVAVTMSCPLVLSAGSHLAKGQSPQEGRARIAEGLKACLPYAQEKGIGLAIEDFGVAQTLQCAAKDCLDVLESAPGTAFVFDTGNFYFAGEDPLDSFVKLASRTVHVHFKDWVKSTTPEIADVSGAALGAGFIPNAELVRRFMALGNAAYFSVELGGTDDVFAGARRDLDTLHNWIRTVA